MFYDIISLLKIRRASDKRIKTKICAKQCFIIVRNDILKKNGDEYDI